MNVGFAFAHSVASNPEKTALYYAVLSARAAAIPGDLAAGEG